MSLMQIKNVSKSFKRAGSQELLVLDQVNFSIDSGEVIALLGKSGSGKSTLLRIIAGLIRASSGQVIYRDAIVRRPMPGLTMVFQHFALLPWLTVLKNVELGLEAQGVSRLQRRKRALSAIDIVGLDGFESAYPKELSGGMSQRVGIARALVVEPEILLMDEPFSALDVLTAENLRTDLMTILQSKKTRIKSVLLVTHNIEEAAFLADRILVFSSSPGSVRSEIKVDLPNLRHDQDPAFRQLVDAVYTLMTSPEEKTEPTVKKQRIDIGHPLPKVEISAITGLIEMLVAPELKERVDLPEVADHFHLEIDDLFPVTEALEILRFARIAEGDIELTKMGRELAQADILEKKKIFAAHLVHYVPLARHIRSALDRHFVHKMPESFFLDELKHHLSEQAAEETLKVVIDWGRYAEIFAYDANTHLLSLENPT